MILPRSTRLFIAVYVIVLMWSGAQPKDHFTWFLEVFPALLGAAFLVVISKRFQFSSFTSFLILIHCCILFVGGHYTYAEVPLFNWIRDAMGWMRNDYDKVGHFAQGFVPALIAREVFIRRSVLQRTNWLPFLVVCICLAISATYELFEWLIAILTGQSSEAFLGTQGDPWDTQSDMLMALIGASVALLLFSRLQDRFLTPHAEEKQS